MDEKNLEEVYDAAIKFKNEFNLYNRPLKGSSMKKKMIWKLLIEDGYFKDKKTVESWIMAGKVICNEERIISAGQLVKSDCDIKIKDYTSKYEGKGGIKLEHALSFFDIDVNGKISLDTGASTGGFTDCLIKHGSSKVYAIDVGYGQLTGKLRANKKVINMERTNISDVTPQMLCPRPSIATVDLSYLSLKVGVPIISKLLQPDGHLICLVKPLFEIDDPTIRRSGVISDHNIYIDTLRDLINFFERIHIECNGVTHSTVTGNKDTKEFFLWLSLKPSNNRKNLHEEILKAVDEALNLNKYKKT